MRKEEFLRKFDVLIHSGIKLEKKSWLQHP